MAYVAPTAETLKTRYPAFASVDDEVVEYWLTDALLIVKDTWIEDDRANAEMALAAHNMSTQGYGTTGGAVGSLSAMGVTDFKSASMAVSFDAETVRRSGEGGYGSTRYGADFMAYLRRNRGGPRLVSCA